MIFPSASLIALPPCDNILSRKTFFASLKSFTDRIVNRRESQLGRMVLERWVPPLTDRNSLLRRIWKEAPVSFRSAQKIAYSTVSSHL